jgi:prophage DNA circulation protein
LEYALPRTDRQEDKLKNPDSKNDSTIKQATDTIKNAAENIENTVEKTINEAQDIVEDIID